MLNGSQPDSCLSVPDNCRDSININPPPPTDSLDPAVSTRGSLHHPRRPSPWLLLSSLESPRVRGTPPAIPRTRPRLATDRPNGAATGKPRRLPKTRVRVCGKRGATSTGTMPLGSDMPLQVC